MRWKLLQESLLVLSPLQINVNLKLLVHFPLPKSFDLGLLKPSMNEMSSTNYTTCLVSNARTASWSFFLISLLCCLPLFVPTTSVPLPSDQLTIQEPSNFNDDAFELYSPSFQVHLSTSVDTTSQIPATAGSVTSSNHQLYFNPTIPIQVSTTATAVISPSNPSLSAWGCSPRAPIATMAPFHPKPRPFHHISQFPYFNWA